MWIAIVVLLYLFVLIALKKVQHHQTRFFYERKSFLFIYFFNDIHFNTLVKQQSVMVFSCMPTMPIYLQSDFSSSSQFLFHVLRIIYIYQLPCSVVLWNGEKSIPTIRNKVWNVIRCLFVFTKPLVTTNKWRARCYILKALDRN